MRNPIGIMLGRLSPLNNGKIQAFPWDSWKEEFFQAKEIGLDLIDWVVDRDRIYENPLLTVQGIKEVKGLVSQAKIRVGSVCAHCFVQRPLLGYSSSELKEQIHILELLIKCSGQAGIKYLEIPLLENSAIRNEGDMGQIVQIVRPRLEEAYRLGVTLTFETSLSAEMLKVFLLMLNHPAAKVTYDMGNSAFFGYNPREEIEAYGKMVATVHVKDQMLGGNSMSLGQGNTDFAACFSMLKAKKYNGPFILEAARADNEIESARKNIAFVRKFLE